MKNYLKKELQELLENQIISAETVTNIENYYAAKTVEESSKNRLFIVFGSIGALLVGLGVILIIAHNWDNLSRMLKTTIAFLPLIASQILVGYTIVKKKNAVWKETAGILLFFSVAASITLISQIYHIMGSLKEFYATWIVLCFPLMYILKSRAVALLHIIVSTCYALEFYSFLEYNVDSPWYYFLFIGLVVPFYMQLLKTKPNENSTTIFNWVLPLSLIIALGAFINNLNFIGFIMYNALFGLLYVIGGLPVFYNNKLRANGYRILGSLGIVITLLITSFKITWETISIEIYLFNSFEMYATMLFYFFTILVLIYTFNKNLRGAINLFSIASLICAVLFFNGVNAPSATAILINIFLLILAVTTIKIGVNSYNFGVLNYGMLIITALVFCRFFDTNLSFITRGLLFIGVGIGFFITNYIMIKNKNKSKKMKQ